MTLEPGIHYGVPADVYHSVEATPTPALTAGALIKLIKCGPAAAWVYANHPSPPKSALEFGTAAHIAFLEGHRWQESVRVIEEYHDKTGELLNDMRTKKVNAAFEAARAEGLTPLLPKDVEALEAMGKAMRNELGTPFNTAAPFLADIFSGGHAEVTAVVAGNDGMPWMKIRPDYVHRASDLDILVDYKTSAMNDRIDWQATEHRWDIRAAFYLRRWREAGGRDAAYLYVRQCSTEYPHFVRYAMLTDEDLGLAAAEVNDGIALWQQCAAANAWPSYVESPHIISIKRR